MQSVKQFLQTS